MSKLVSTLVLSVIFLTGYSQTPLRVSRDAKVDLSGTSTLHDWEMESSMITGQANIEIAGTEVKDVKSLSISIPAESLKSDKEAMDKNAYKSLKTGSNKNITFQTTKVVSITKSGAGYEVTCEGKLQIAGTTKTTTIKAVCTSDGTTVRCKGQKTFNMSEYNVEPPSFMFGSVRTGDEITIGFNVLFTK